MSFSKCARFPILRRDHTPGPGAYDVQWGGIGGETHKNKLHNNPRFKEECKNHRRDRRDSELWRRRTSNNQKTPHETNLRHFPCNQNPLKNKSNPVHSEIRKSYREPFYARQNKMESSDKKEKASKTAITSANKENIPINTQSSEPSRIPRSFEKPIKSETIQGGVKKSKSRNKVELKYIVLGNTSTQNGKRKQNSCNEENESHSENMLNHAEFKRKPRQLWNKPSVHSDFQLQIKKGIYKNGKRQIFDEDLHQYETSENKQEKLNYQKYIPEKLMEQKQYAPVDDKCTLDSEGNCRIHVKSCDLYWKNFHTLKSMKLLKRSLNQRDSNTGRILNLMTFLEQQTTHFRLK